MKYSLVLSKATEMRHLHIMNMHGEKKRGLQKAAECSLCLG